MNLFDWLCDEAKAISAEAMLIPPSKQQLEWSEDERRTRWLQCLGLWPLPERTPLEAEVTGTLERDDYLCAAIRGARLTSPTSRTPAGSARTAT